jgi:hypothetical protein
MYENTKTKRQFPEEYMGFQSLPRKQSNQTYGTCFKARQVRIQYFAPGSIMVNGIHDENVRVIGIIFQAL